MKIDNLLSSISAMARNNGITEPFVVGGLPRDRLLGQHGEKSKIKDIDLTTGSVDIKKLAILIARKYPQSSFRIYDDGHSSINIMGINIDFSNNFIIPNIDDELKKINIENINSMTREIYSRDFTINTIMESLDFKSIYDITGKGINDLNSKIIQCPINPNITIGVDPRRILRAIKFSIKYNFNIEGNLKEALLKNKEKIQTLPTKFVQDKVSELLQIDADKAVEALSEYKLLPLLPMTKTLSDILIQKRKLLSAI